MILDCHRYGDHAQDFARRHHILDFTRGIWLNDLPVFYVDDVAGIYRVYEKDADGDFVFDMEKEEMRYIEYRAEIRFIPKEEATT